MDKTAAKDWSDVGIIFFDLDDTLCGYWVASKAALRKTFETHTLPGETPESMLEQWALAFREFSPTLKQTGWYESYLRKGESTRNEQMRLTLMRMGIDDPILAKKLGDSYANERDNNLALFPETLEVLDLLKCRFPLGVITNGPADVQRQEIATLGIAHYFDHVYIEGEMGRGKPLPEVFEMIADEVGREPGQILFVGNSYNHDIKPAILASWHSAWIRRDTDVAPSTTSEHPEDMPADSPHPDAIIHDLRDLLPMLKK